MKKYLIIFTERFPECYEGTRQYCKTVDTKAEVKEEIRKLKESPFTVSFIAYSIYCGVTRMRLWRFNLHKTNAANEELVISLFYGRKVQE